VRELVQSYLGERDEGEVVEVAGAGEAVVVVVVEVVEFGVGVGGRAEAAAGAGATDRRVDGLDLTGGRREEGSLSTAGLDRGFADGILDAMDYAMRQPGLFVLRYLALAPQSALICPAVGREREASKQVRWWRSGSAVARPSLSSVSGAGGFAASLVLAGCRWMGDGRWESSLGGRVSLWASTSDYV
jgi:hypothetical protein